MLSTLKLSNFKGHRDIEINFDDSRLHAIVGQNSSGKTSILQGCLCIYQTQNYQIFRKDLKGFGANIDDRGNIDDRAILEKYNPEFIVTKNEDIMSVVGSSRVGPTPWQRQFGLNEINLFEWQPFMDSKMQYGGIGIGRASYIKLMLNNLSKAAYSESVAPEIAVDGSGLAPYLDYLKNDYPEKFQLLQEMLQQIVPAVRKINIRRAKVKIDRQNHIEVNGKTINYEDSQEVTGQEIVLDMTTGDRIPASAVSEGTLLTLGLLAILVNPNRPDLILLDDIEQGLHPKAQRELITVVKNIINTNPDLQIIFSTHSPYIIDELEPSQVHVLGMGKNGFTQTKRLDEHPDVGWAKATLTTGEFWDAEGEDWVVTEAEGERDD